MSPDRVMSSVQRIGGRPFRRRTHAGQIIQVGITRRLARQHNMVASFSRALTEGLTAQQSDAEFNAALDHAIESIFQASKT